MHLETLAATRYLANSLAKACRGGEIIELRGDLGAGKTTFVAAFMESLGYKQAVSSPTFSLQNIYELDNRNVYHFDLYRLDDLGSVAHDLDDALADDTGIVIIEWVRDININKKYMTVTLELDSNENARRATLHIPTKLAYLADGLNDL